MIEDEQQTDGQNFVAGGRNQEEEIRQAESLTPLTQAFVRLIYTDTDYYTAALGNAESLATLYSSRSADIQRINATLEALRAEGAFDDIDLSHLIDRLQARDKLAQSLPASRSLFRVIADALVNAPQIIKNAREHTLGTQGTQFRMNEALKSPNEAELKQVIRDITATFSTRA